MKQLAGKTAIITGAGSGIGREMSVLFAGEGANVFASDVNLTGLDELSKIIKTNGGSVYTYKANVANETEVNQMIQKSISVFNSIDILVNNAGIMDDFMPVAETSTELWNRVMGVNINGPFFTCREVIPVMLKQGGGVIINIASVGGLNGSRAGVSYTASKHALIGLTKNTAFMYALNGIRCNAIAPGAVKTAIGAGMHPNALGYAKLNLGLGANPRAGEPGEIAELALFLASGKSGFINGSVITADGGWTAY
jgi:NAD(P)-dependent dehydrogenase (short-subunit alcohol dehydrogenase family)